METPMSTRTVTRSQTLAASNNNNSNVTISRKDEESEVDLTKSKQRNGSKQHQQQDRSALIDITNDSPIAGLAMTPASSIVKQRGIRCKQTPGSGEALLRGQVKTLLQKVEEEASGLAKLSSSEQKGGPILHLKGLVNSPMGLLAPTPTNTPNVLNLIAHQCMNRNPIVGSASITFSPPVIEEQMNIFQVVEDMVDEEMQEGTLESQRSVITRSLLLDFSEKSEISVDSSVVLYQEMCGSEREGRGKSSSDDDNASVWSIQVNASACDEEGIERELEGCYDEEDAEYEQEEEEDGDCIDELCEGLNKTSLNEMRKAPQFAGKHTRFVYNSDDEIEACEEPNETSVKEMRRAPKFAGKHTRFVYNSDDEIGGEVAAAAVGA